MATDRRLLPAFLSNDADFRSWGSGIAAQLAAVGMVQTADTGQINWGSATRPAAGAYAGYEIWRFNDEIHLTAAPVYLRIQYGTTSGAQDRPALRVQTGVSTNGAGTLGTQTSTTYTVEVNNSKGAGAMLYSYASGDGGRLTLATNIDLSSSNFGMLICLDRTRGTNGVPTAEGLLKYTQSTFSTCQWSLHNFGGAVVSSSNASSMSAINPGWRALGSIRGKEEALGGFAVAFAGIPKWPLAWFTHFTLDATAPAQGTYLGATHTFQSIATACGTNFRFATTTPQPSQAIIYE